jgi:hypothetical protein
MLLALFLFALLYGEYDRINSVYQIPLQYMHVRREALAFVHTWREREESIRSFMHGEERFCHGEERFHFRFFVSSFPGYFVRYFVASGL